LSTVGVKTPSFATTTLGARVLRHDEVYGLSTLYSGDGELRVPLVAVNSGVTVTIYARDVSIALSRPMDVSITNRLPGTIVAIEPLPLPLRVCHLRSRHDPA
jgi:molybdate transport system ATP-binding protein